MRDNFFREGQPDPFLTNLLHDYGKQTELEYRGERYRVRDNGAVYRLSRPERPRRRLDETWTFGNPSKSSGYMTVSDHVVHRIVAIAFLGESPSDNHVVDHLDTNRRNNRVENLRWVTRLENLLLNPITARRIELVYGSLDRFFEDPSSSANFENPSSDAIRSFEWMRTVSRDEAQATRQRLLQWAESGAIPKGGALGEWLYRNAPNIPEPTPEPDTLPSLTKSAVQMRWRTPTEFPECPIATSDTAMEEYENRLEFGTVFARNQFGEGRVVRADLGQSEYLSVLCRAAPGSVKDWTLAKVYVDRGMFCHESVGTFFTLQGALKRHCELIDEPFNESVDDYS